MLRHLGVIQGSIDQPRLFKGLGISEKDCEMPLLSTQGLLLVGCWLSREQTVSDKEAMSPESTAPVGPNPPW